MKVSFPLVVVAFVLTFTPIVSSIEHPQRQSRKTQTAPEPVQVIKDLRAGILTSTPAKLGLSHFRITHKVYGVVMETGYPKGVATLVALRDGSASLYLGHGGGIIGGISHENVRKAAADFVQESERHATDMRSTKAFPYAAVARVKFYVLTFDGVVTAEADEDTLGEGEHELSPLFLKGHEVLTQLWSVSGKK